MIKANAIKNINNLKICTIHKYFKMLLGELGAWYGYSRDISISNYSEKLSNYIENIINY